MHVELALLQNQENNWKNCNYSGQQTCLHFFDQFFLKHQASQHPSVLLRYAHPSESRSRFNLQKRKAALPVMNQPAGESFSRTDSAAVFGIRFMPAAQLEDNSRNDTLIQLRCLVFHRRNVFFLGHLFSVIF